MNVKTNVAACGLALLMCNGQSHSQTNSDSLDVTAEIDSDARSYELIPPAVDSSLYLEVFVNGSPTGLVAEFTHHTDNRFSSPRSELTEVGIKSPFGVTKNVYLDTVSGLRFRYDSTGQAIYMSAPIRSLLPKVKSGTRRHEFVEPDRGTGAVLNYAIATEVSSGPTQSGLDYSGLTGSLDGWVFSPFGVLSGSGFFKTDPTNLTKSDFVRQETRLELNNTKNATSLTLGDFQTSSVAWSRPIRMGGVQFRRDFTLRSDIVTEQLFSFSGAAAVPSTVDIFIENNRAYSGTVDRGPFRLEDVPVFTGSGDAVVVIRDADGQERSQEVSFFASQNLVKKGTFDFSFEAGKAREAYGTQSNQYGVDKAYSASLKYGLNEKITLDGHVEGKNDLLMGGVGFTTVPFNVAEFSLAAGASKYNGEVAGFVHTTLRTTVKDVDVQFSVLRSEPGFADLAYATGVDFLGQGALVKNASLLEFPTATEVLSLGVPISESGQDIGLSLIHSVRASSEDLIASASYAHDLGIGNASVSLFGSHNMKTDNTRVSLSLVVPIGKRGQVRSSVANDADGQVNSNFSLSRPIGDKVGDYGYQAQLDRTGSKTFAGVRGSYRSRYAKIGGEVIKSGNNSFARATAEGSIVFSGGKMAAGNRITDSFAIVDVGAPEIPVMLQNREVTKTSKSGRALVPGLTSFRRNRVSVDLAEVPRDVMLNASAMEVIPARKSGSLIDFSSSKGEAALVTVVDQGGNFIEPGSFVTVNKSKEDYVVGYDGLVWVENIKSNNTMKIETQGGTCVARFQFVATAELQQTIGPVTCK